MTNEDEKVFCQELKASNSNIAFFSTAPSLDSNIDSKLFDCMTNSSSPFFSIVNFDLVSKDELGIRYKKYGEYYHFADIYRDQIQFFRSRHNPPGSQDLQCGRLADSYNPNDDEEKSWKKKVYSILKKLGHKVYWFYSTQEGLPEIGAKPENRFVALSDSLQKYSGLNGYFLVDNKARFVGKGITVEQLKHPQIK